MPDDYRISDLSTAPSIGNSDLMELSVVNTASETGYTSMKAPVLNLANKIVNATQYVSDLQTQNKTITGAINELAQGGGGGGGDADIVKTASGNPCSFSTSYAGALKSLTASIVCGGGYDADTQTEHPLVGHTELNLTRCSINQFDEVWEKGTINQTTGEEETNAYISRSGFIPIAPNTRYYYGYTAQNNVRGFYYDSNKNYIGTFIAYANNTFVSDVNASYLRVIIGDVDGIPPLTINYPSTDTAYHAYNGQTFTVAFGQTVYGGVYDKSGRLTITWGAVDLGSLTYTYDSAAPRFYSSGLANVIKKPPTNNDVANILCDIYAVVSLNDIYGGNDNLIACSNGGAISVINTAYTDAPTFKTAMSGKYLAYELATPIVIDVPSISVFAENGTNNIISDGGGDVDVEYYTDLAEDIKDFIGDDVEVGDLANVEITTPSNNQVLKYDSTSQKWVNGTGGGGASWVDITGTLLAGNTFMSWGSHPDIHADSTVDIYVDTAFYGVAPLTVSLSEGSLSLTFEAQSADMPVKVRIT